MTHQKLIKDLLLYFALLCWFVVPIRAQLTIFADYSISQDILTFEVKVKNFVGVTAFQYPVNWDSTVLKFQSVEINSLKAFENVNANPFSGNQFRMLWQDQSTRGVTIPNNTTLSTFKFKLLNTAIDTIKLDFDSQKNIIVEFVNTESSPIDLEVQNTEIVFIRTSNEALKPSKFKVQAFPNPFSDEINLKITETKGKEVKINIFNASGGIIYTKKIVSYNNTLNEELNRSIFSSGSGLYFLTITTEKISKTLKLILNDTY